MSSNGTRLRQKKQNYETVSSYIDYLQEPYLILKADRYDVKGKEILKKVLQNIMPMTTATTTISLKAMDMVKALCLKTMYIKRCAGRDIRSMLGKCWILRLIFCINHDNRLYVQSSWTLDNDDTAGVNTNLLNPLPTVTPR